MLVCKHCGKDLSRKLYGAYWIGEDAFCDKQCAERAGYIQCPKCGKMKPYLVEVEGESSMCEECFDKRLAKGEIFYCHDCGKPSYRYAGHAITYNGETYKVCDRCSRRYVRCVGCNTLIKLDRPRNPNRRYLCDACKELGSFCENCGRFCRHENLTEFRDGYRYCDSCIGGRDYSWCSEHNYIRSYHASHNGDWAPIVADWQIERDPDRFVGYGFELETERTEDGVLLCDAIERIREIDEHRYFRIERDGSLSLGFEMITRPFTKEAWPLVFDKASQIMNYLRESSYISGTNGSNCGLHFHVSKTLLNAEAQAKLLIFADHFEDELLKLSRRTSSSFSTWARVAKLMKPTFQNLGHYTLQRRVDFVKTEYVYNHSRIARHSAINLRNSDTVEFRFFKGTLVPEYLAAAFEFVNFLVELATKTTPYGVYRMTGNSFKDKAKGYSPTLKSYISAAEKNELKAA